MRASAVPWLPILLTAACGSVSDAVQASCQHTCQQLARCSLMPSLLGTEVGDVSSLQNCQARCEDSPATRNAIGACMEPVVTAAADAGSDPARDQRALWCADGAGDAPCERARRCLRSELNGATLSVAEVSIELRRGLHEDASHRFPSPREELCTSEETACCEPVESPPEERFEICEDLGVETLQVSLLEGERRTLLTEQSLPCEQGVDRRFRLTVETGKVRALVTMIGRESATAEPFCYEWYSPARVASPEAQTELAIPIPSPSQLDRHRGNASLSWPILCAPSASP